MRAILVLVTGLAFATPAAADDWWRVKPGESYGPETYCAWNRTGLPSAQQAVCSKRDAAIRARKPTPSIKAFLDAAAPAQRNITLASWAVMCSLRSERWLHPITVSYQQYMRETANRFGIGNEGLDAADVQSETITRQLRSKVTCKTLTNSAVMDELDDIQRRATGGYR